MWNEIFKELGLLYVEDEPFFNKFKKWFRRSVLIMFWSPVYWFLKFAKRMGWKIGNNPNL